MNKLLIFFGICVTLNVYSATYQVAFPSSGGGGSLAVNGTGQVTNLVNSATVTITAAGGSASFAATPALFNGLLICPDDDTTHALSIAKIGTNYLLEISQETNLPGQSLIGLPAPAIEVVQTTDLARVFIPNANGLATEYLLMRDTAAPSQNIWRLAGTYISTRSGPFTYSRNFFGGNPICDEGGWEFAVKVSTEANYVGTYHGYDILSSAYLLCDDFAVTNAAANLRCKQFELVQRSTVYHDASTNVLAYKTTKLSFSTAGVHCKQRIEWQDNATLDHAYLGMMPIEREIGGYQITDTGFVSPVCLQQDVSASGHSLILSSTGDYIKIWGVTSGVTASMEMLEWQVPTHNAWISDSVFYNKLYFDTPGAVVTPATVWNAEWICAISIVE